MEKESEEQDDYGFAFDHPNFSDTVLRLEIESDFPETRASGRDEGMPNEQGHETAQEPETSSSVHCSVVRMKTIHISSPILAADSPFFYRLFTGEKRDLAQRHVTLRIDASEEDAIMDLLNFFYRKKLRSSTPKALLDVLVAADRFEAASCVRYCSQLLQKLPMSCEFAFLYLDVLPKIQMTDTAVQPLTDAAKKLIAARFKDISNEEEVLNLPLVGFEAVLSNEDLEVATEDFIFDIAIRWAEKHYPELESRREILSTRILPYIRFPYMSCLGLKHALSRGEDIGTKFALEVVINALFYKAGESPYTDRSLSFCAEGSRHSPDRIEERPSKLKPIKVVEFESPRQQRICYLDLTRDECLRLVPSGSISSEWFDIGPHCFVLSGYRYKESFGLFLGMVEKGLGSLTLEFEFASWAESAQDFITKHRAKRTFNGGTSFGSRNLFCVPWNKFIDEDGPCFVEGVLHLRADIKVKQQ